MLRCGCYVDLTMPFYLGSGASLPLYGDRDSFGFFDPN
jgi:hypothetical protein